MTTGLLVFQSDFGKSDGAVSAMHGVANSVQRGIPIYEITHQIPQYNIWEASYRLLQAIGYWPSETVFVSIVDPGVGSDRRGVVAKTVNNHYIITPDNGTLTHVSQFIGIRKFGKLMKPSTDFQTPANHIHSTDAIFLLIQVHGSLLALSSLKKSDQHSTQRKIIALPLKNIKNC